MSKTLTSKDAKKGAGNGPQPVMVGGLCHIQRCGVSTDYNFLFTDELGQGENQRVKLYLYSVMKRDTRQCHVLILSS